MQINQLKMIQTFSLMTVCLLAGCSSKAADTPELGLVTGTITLDGSPLPQASITFQPQSGALSVGMTDDSGLYELAYNKDNLGAVPGQHTVRISKRGEAGSPNDTEDQVPAKFNQNSELTAEVKAGENEIDFDLKTK